MIEVNVTGTEAVRAKLQQVGAALTKQALAETVVEVEEYIRQQASVHHKTGALVRSIFKAKSQDGWIVGHDLQHAPHALFVHWGTKPHVIRPKNKKVLRWAAGGKFFFAKKVNHPGNAPDKWLERAAALAPQVFAKHVEAKLRAL